MFTLSQLPLLSSLLNLIPDTNTNTNTNTANQLPLLEHPQCPNPPSQSCPFPPPRSINTCCLNHPSGHFLQTQFWDTSPALGPNDSFTIHGLWPDLCTGGFEQFCDSARAHDDIRDVLGALARPDLSRPLLAFMDEYWLSLDGRDERLWAHEWNKHGTCISTLEPACYGRDGDGDGDDDDDPDSKSEPDPDLAVLDYLIHTTSLFRTLDTYAVLAEAGITPSERQTYTLRELEEAIETSAHGHPVTFRCNRFGELDEVWYHFSVAGSLRNEYPPAPAPADPARFDDDNDDGTPFLHATAIRDIFIPTGPDGAKSNCPARGIKYRPKSQSKRPGDDDPRLPPAPPTASPTRTVTSATRVPTAPPFTGKGHLQVHVLDDAPARSSAHEKGCLIRLGTWYTSGTCATFQAQPDVVDPGHAPLFSLSSSYSPCLISPATGRFECNRSSAVQGIFAADPKHPTVLSYQNRTVFYADRVPGRFEKVDIYADDGGGARQTELEIHWVAV